MSDCDHEWIEGDYEAGEEDYCSRCIQSRKDIRTAELEAENADLWQFFSEVKSHESASYWMEYPIKELEEKYKPPKDGLVPDAGSWEEFSKFFV